MKTNPKFTKKQMMVMGLQSPATTKLNDAPGKVVAKLTENGVRCALWLGVPSRNVFHEAFELYEKTYGKRSKYDFRLLQYG